MAQYEENQIEFAIMSLVKDPMERSIAELAANLKCISAISKRLSELQPTQSNETQGPPLTNGNTSHLESLEKDFADLGVAPAQIDASEIPENVKILLAGDSIAALVKYLDELAEMQSELERQILDEQYARLQDAEKADARCRDLGGKMQKFARKVKQKSRE